MDTQEMQQRLASIRLKVFPHSIPTPTSRPSAPARSRLCPGGLSYLHPIPSPHPRMPVRRVSLGGDRSAAATSGLLPCSSSTPRSALETSLSHQKEKCNPSAV